METAGKVEFRGFLLGCKEAITRAAHQENPDSS